MILVKKICLIFLLWISIICGVFVFLLGTNMGTYLTLAGITYCIPGLTFDSVSGRWGNFNVTHVVYKMSTGVIDIDKCNILLNLRYLWNKQIYIDYIFLRDISIKIKNIDIADKENKRHEKIKINNAFSIPFPIIFKNIVLHNTRVNSNDIIFKLKKLNTGLILEKNLLTVLPVYIKGAILNISGINILNIKKNATNIYKFGNQFNLNFYLKSLSSKLLTALPSFHIPLNIIIENIQGENLYIFDNYHNYYIIHRFSLQTYLYNQSASIKLNFRLPYGNFNVIGNIAFKEYYPVNIIANYILYHDNSNSNFENIKKQDASKIQVVLTGELYNEICFHCNFLGIISTVHILLKVNLTQIGVPISVSIIGRKIPISFLGKDDCLIEEINLCLNGAIRNYYIQATSRLSSSKFSSLVHIIFNAQGDVSGCTISKLRMTVLDGYLDMQGAVNWDNIVNWNSVFVLNEINIFSKWLNHSIKFSGNIIVQGSLSPNAWEIKVSDLNINGYIEENNRILCTGSGALLYGNSTVKWKIPTLLIKWGSNVLEMQGDLEKDSILRIMFKAPDCNVILPELSGSVYGELELCGSVRYPRLLLKFDGCSLCWRDKNINLNKMILNSDIHFDGLTQSKFFLQADNIRCGIFLLRQLIVQGQGNINKHYLNLTTSGDMLSGQMKLCGNLDLFHKNWHGSIDKTHIVTPIGIWKLMQDVAVTYQYLAQKITVNTHYWEIVDCTIPISDIFKLNIFKKIHPWFKNFNTVSLKFLSPDLINIHTVRIYCTNFHWILGACLPRGTVLFSGTECNIRSFVGKEEITPIVINNVIVRIILTQTTSYCEWFMNIGNNDKNYGLFRIITSSDGSKILGNIQIKNISLMSFCNSLIPLAGEPIKGLLNLNIHFYGYSHHLKIYGSAQLQHFSFKANMPFFVEDGQIFIRFFGDNAILNGTVDTDSGCKLYFKGNIVNFDSIDNIRVSFKVWGDQVNFCMSPEIKAKISPNIVCTITSEKINIQGNIEIPWARIVVKERSKNMVRISSEEILLDDNLQPILDSSKHFFNSISAKITVCLGNDFNFNGLGLLVKLKGNLEIEYNNENHLDLIRGHVDISSGYFQVYGQNLVIKKGHLLFSGAVNQPYFDIEAICDPSSIKDRSVAGIRITGVFNQPKLELFSYNSFALSSEEVKSYLLLGNPSNLILFNTDINVITPLLIGASVRNTEKFINKIGKLFGVQDLTLNTQDINSATPLVALTGYIAPGLQVKYGVSIFDLLKTITVRYCLYSQFYLEITSGNNQAFDILYKFYF